MKERSQLFLEKYLSSLSSECRKKYSYFSSGYFCADEYNANLCAELILRGEKRATCSMDYSHEGEQMPEVGHLQVVTHWNGDPVCIVEITSVSKCKYGDVPEIFAVEEGEGDKTLEWWENSLEFFLTKMQRVRHGAK